MAVVLLPQKVVSQWGDMRKSLQRELSRITNKKDHAMPF